MSCRGEERTGEEWRGEERGGAALGLGEREKKKRRGKKAMKAAQSGGPQCLLGYCFSENRRSAAGQEKTGQYHSVFFFREGILLHACLNNSLRGIIDQHYRMKEEGSLNGLKLFLNCCQMNADHIRSAAFAGRGAPRVKNPARCIF